MATRSEFRRAAWRHWGGHVGRGLGALGLGTFAFVGLWFVLELAEPGEPAETRAEIALSVAMVVGLATAVMLARASVQHGHDDPRLVCPRCGRTLGYYYVMFVLSSGLCPHCGEDVLEDG